MPRRGAGRRSPTRGARTAGATPHSDRVRQRRRRAPRHALSSGRKCGACRHLDPTGCGRRPAAGRCWSPWQCVANAITALASSSLGWWQASRCIHPRYKPRHHDWCHHSTVSRAANRLDEFHDVCAPLGLYADRRFMHLELDMTNRCNLRCVMCYHSFESTRRARTVLHDVREDFDCHRVARPAARRSTQSVARQRAADVAALHPDPADRRPLRRCRT